MIVDAFVGLVALVISGIALAQISGLRRRIDDLERLIRPDADRSGAAQPGGTVPVASPSPTTSPPVPQLSPAPASPPPIPVISRQKVPGTAKWESIVGVRLFAWIGGLAFFLGIVFFVSYAFENNLITPPMRIASGGLTGIVLIVAGLLPVLRRYRIPAQSLIATGVLICYADVYAGHSFYALISLTAALVVMWVITAAAFALALGMEAPPVLSLALVGGFLTPLLFRSRYETALTLFAYTGVLNVGVAAISAMKRWTYFLVAASVATVILEFTWAADFFGPSYVQTVRLFLFGSAGLFLLIAIALLRAQRGDLFTFSAGAVSVLAPLLGFMMDPKRALPLWDAGFLTPVFSVSGSLILCGTYAGVLRSRAQSLTLALCLCLTCAGELAWWYAAAGDQDLTSAISGLPHSVASIAAWHTALFLLFAAAPYVCGEKQAWPWIIAAAAGFPQFCFVHHYLTAGSQPPISYPLHWVIPGCFAIPAAVGIHHLVVRRGIALSSADARLASQGAAFLGFVSLIFPVQFHREWITVGWALEGVGLILLYRWLPNRRRRLFALIIFCAAFVRLALNEAVLTYRPRAHLPVLNWYLYGYGVPGLCLLTAGYQFGSPRGHRYERHGPALLFTLGGTLFFLLLNIEIADYFSIGPALTFSFAGNFARDMTYTIGWSVFAFALLVVGMMKRTRAVRLAGMGLLCVALIKLFFHDLDNLSQLYRVGALISVAVVAIVASFAYQKFLGPVLKA